MLRSLRAYVWSAVDIDSGGLLALEASCGGSRLNTLIFPMNILKLCIGKPIIVVGRRL